MRIGAVCASEMLTVVRRFGTRPESSRTDMFLDASTAVGRNLNLGARRCVWGDLRLRERPCAHGKICGGFSYGKARERAVTIA